MMDATYVSNGDEVCIEIEEEEDSDDGGDCDSNYIDFTTGRNFVYVEPNPALNSIGCNNADYTV